MIRETWRRITHWSRLYLFILWGLRLVIGTFLRCSERQGSKFGTKQLPRDEHAPTNGGGGKWEGWVMGDGSEESKNKKVRDDHNHMETERAEWAREGGKFRECTQRHTAEWGGLGRGVCVGSEPRHWISKWHNKTIRKPREKLRNGMGSSIFRRRRLGRVWGRKKKIKGRGDGGRERKPLLFYTLVVKLSPSQEFSWLCPPSGMSSHFLCLCCARTGLSSAPTLPLCSDSTLKKRWRSHKCGQDTSDKEQTPGEENKILGLTPRPTRNRLNGIWAWKNQRQLQSSAELLSEGVPFPLYGNRAEKSFELVCFLLHACLVLVLTEFHLVCFCLCRTCVGVLCVCSSVCLFCLLALSLPVVCMWGFCFGTRGGLVFVVDLDAPSPPQAWILHSNSAASAGFKPLWWSVFVGETQQPGRSN